jgi:hypothetical protein
MDKKFRIAVLIAVAAAFAGCTKNDVVPTKAQVTHYNTKVFDSPDSAGGSGEQNPPVQGSVRRRSVN